MPRWACLSLLLLLVVGPIAAAREPWTTSRVVGSPDPPPPYLVERVFPALSFNRPVELIAVPGTDRLALVEVDGRIVTFRNQPDVAEVELFFDVAAHWPELRHVYGLEFSPGFERDREVYVCYVAKGPVDDGSRLSRFRVTSDDPPRVDPASEEILLTWLSGGHNGGCLKFGQDGYLYVSTGDGTGPHPPDIHGGGQDVSNLLSSILRIDVRRREGNRPYAIPADNPFVDLPGARPEIWAYGFRNPWKMCVDPASGRLWVGDVGWELWELVYLVQRGGNYGWSIVEGRQPVHPDGQRGPTPILPPVVDHPHTEAQSVTGGYVYRGTQRPELVGVYIYGDYNTGKVWGLRYDGQQVTYHRELASTPLQIVCFAEDAAGELYVVDYGGGIYRLVPTPPATSLRPFPQRLSETGLFASVGEQIPAAGVMEYTMAAPAWHDGATARRWLALPNLDQIDAALNVWKYPAGTVFAKTLTLGSTHVETQLLHFDGLAWRGYSYAWNDEQTDAELIPAGGEKRRWSVAAASPDAADGDTPAEAFQTWHYSSRAECLVCHNRRFNYAIGFELAQLSGDASGVTPLEALEGLNLFSAGPVPRQRDAVPLVDPYDTTQPLASRARSYLHANCAHCHRRGGGGNSVFELMHHLPLEQLAVVDCRPVLGDFGIDQAQLVAPGDPSRSVLLYRMATLGAGRMPRIGSHTVDPAGLELLRQWIASLDPANDAPPAQAAPRQSVVQLKQYLADSRSALELLAWFDRGQIDGRRRDRLVAAAQQADPLVRGLFERFVPESHRVQRLGLQVDPAAILALSGNAERGAALFAAGSTAQCKNCHRVGSVGIDVGGDLVAAARKRSPAELLESILVPSKVIDPKYQTWSAETTSGVVYIGLMESRTAEQVVLRDAQNRRHEIPLSEVEALAPQSASLMPDGLYRDMTAQELADLLAWLVSLGQQ